MAAQLVEAVGKEEEVAQLEEQEAETLAQQLFYLEERLPPETLGQTSPMIPTPLLFPGEVVKLQQFRVVCTGVFDEPAVGAIFITNLRVIFYGNNISDPDMYDVVRDLQYNHSKKDSVGDFAAISQNSRSRRNRTLRNPTFNSFFTDPGDGGENSSTGGQLEEHKQQQQNPSKIKKKMFDRFASIRRSSGLIKQRIEGWADKRKSGGDQEGKKAHKKRKSGAGHISKRTISSPVKSSFRTLETPFEIASTLKASDSILLSTSAPGTQLEESFSSIKEFKTLPRTMPSHDASSAEQNMSSATNDSGFIDPLKGFLSSEEQLLQTSEKRGRKRHVEEEDGDEADEEEEEEEEDEDGKEWGVQPQILVDALAESSIHSFFLRSAILPPKDGEEVDFERSCEPGLLLQRFPRPAHVRPQSIVEMESDSDSDTISDRYFGSIAEGSEIFSPSSALSFSPTRHPEAVPVQTARMSEIVQSPLVDDKEEVGSRVLEEQLGEENGKEDTNIEKEEKREVAEEEVESTGGKVAEEHKEGEEADDEAENEKEELDKRDEGLPRKSPSADCLVDVMIPCKEGEPLQLVSNSDKKEDENSPATKTTGLEISQGTREEKEKADHQRKEGELLTVSPLTSTSDSSAVSSPNATPIPDDSTPPLNRSDKKDTSPLPVPPPRKKRGSKPPPLEATMNSTATEEERTQERSKRIANPVPKPPRARRRNKITKNHSQTGEGNAQAQPNDSAASSVSPSYSSQEDAPFSPYKEAGSPVPVTKGVSSQQSPVVSDPPPAEGQQAMNDTPSPDTVKKFEKAEKKEPSLDETDDLPVVPLVDKRLLEEADEFVPLSPTSLIGQQLLEEEEEEEESAKRDPDRRHPPSPLSARSPRITSQCSDHGSDLSPRFSTSSQRHGKRSSSLIVNHPSMDGGAYRRLTIHSPLITSSAFEWSSSSHDNVFSSSTWSGSKRLTRNIAYNNKTSLPLSMIHAVNHLPPATLPNSGIKIPDGIVLLCKNFSSLKLYVHPQNAYDATKLKEMFDKELLEPKPVYQSFAFQYHAAVTLICPRLKCSESNVFDFDAEVQRIGILSTTNLWRVTTITKDKPNLCLSYPEKLVVLICTPDVDLIRGAGLYREGRFPTACWMNRNNGAVLLRAAATMTERGQQGTNTSTNPMSVDNAILQAIRSCNASSKLHVFTERSEVSSFSNVQDPKHSQLTAEQAISYYYHNIHFRYTLNAPTFKSIRHSYYKMQGLLENTSISDEEYLVVLDSTKWLSRCSELLKTTNEVCEALCSEGAHVLVAYESGWDRTTQVVSLAQLLMDPYYRTLDGFQVLVQKEWLWFGHPFQSRNFRSSSSRVKEDSPIFLQWMDCVWQVMRQFPSAFQFSENLLMAMVEHSYSTMFGTFLANTDRERTQCFMIPGREHQSVSSDTISFWTWVSMVNTSSNIFVNRIYDSQVHTGLLRPLHYQPCLAVWRTHYDKAAVRQELQEGFTTNTRLQHELKYLQDLYKELHQQIDSTCSSVELLVPKPERPPSSASTQTAFTSVAARRPSSVSGDQTPPPVPPTSPHLYNSIVEYLNQQGCETSICKHITFHPTSCEGYLVKEGAMVKTWKKRWFVLDFVKQYFAYFETVEHFQSRNVPPKGIIPLHKILKVFQSNKRDHIVNNTFQVKTAERTFFIKAPTILSMEIWVACLRLSPSSLVSSK